MLGIPGCGGTFTTDHGEISSPAHDEQYPSNLDCEYKIKLNPNFRIKIIFLSFALEESLRCRFDFLEVPIICVQRQSCILPFPD